MTLEVEATYENGVLKPDEPLPFKEHERLLVTVEAKKPNISLTYGLIGWTGDPDVVLRMALDPEFGVHESP